MSKYPYGDILSKRGGRNMETATTIGLVINAISMIACPIIAHAKGRSAIGWFFGGVILSSIGLIIIACLKKKN